MYGILIKQVEHHHVDKLAYEGGTVVAEPQEPALVTELLFGPFPPGVVGPHVEHLADGIGEQACEHHARGVREHGADGFGHRVALGGDVQEPALRNQNECDVREDADFHAAAGLFFAEDLAHDVGREEGRGENDVTERGVEPEGVHQDKHLDVCRDGADDGPGENALLTEEAEKADEAAEEREDGGDENDFVLHAYFLLSMAVNRRVLASDSNSVPGLP
mgnify:CR=1 FL=1